MLSSACFLRSLPALSTALLLFGCGDTGTTSSGSAASGSGGAGGQAGTSSGGTCGDCSGFSCCGATCVNDKNDIKNCGGCGTTCPGPDPYCDQGNCGTPPCNAGSPSCQGKLCCGSACCNTGELCCMIPGPIGDVLACSPPTAEGTCPKGCLDCKCTSPDTPIATPEGDRPIESLAPGDLVYSVHDEATLSIPILRVNKVPARDHHVVRVTLESGSALEVSPRHPTADGRVFADLRPGDRWGSSTIVDTRLIPYAHPFTYDILPASSTGTYFAAGGLLGSTLFGPGNRARTLAE